MYLIINGRHYELPDNLIHANAAQAYGLPLPPPSTAGNTQKYFQHGAAFAVAAAPALNYSAYKQVTGLNPPGDDHSLSIQLQSFKDLLPVISQGSSKHILPI
jgi:hypothetical protein